MKQNFVIISIIIFFLACKLSNPETVLGLKLGLARDYQINEAIQNGNLKTAGDRHFIEYHGSTIGFLRAWSNTNSDNVEILTTVKIDFVDTLYKHPLETWRELVSEYDVDYIQRIYNEKYGEPDSKDTFQNLVSHNYKEIWERGDLIITLETYFYDNYLDKKYYTVRATYQYKDSIMKKLEDDENKNRKSI